MSELEFIQKLKELGIELPTDAIEKFSFYCKFLLEYNEHTNLTAIKLPKDVFLKHFYDSILLSKFYKFDYQCVLDIGSGAGFPGVPLKICFPDIELTLLDSNGKKAAFLEELKHKLDIDFKVINDRAESYALKSREAYDVVISRAVTQMPILAELSLPFVKIGGYFIPYKGNLDDSLENGKYAIEILGGSIERIEKTFLPFDNAPRSFVFVNKKSKTDEKYPRPFDKISKKPLQKNR